MRISSVVLSLLLAPRPFMLGGMADGHLMAERQGNILYARLVRLELACLSGHYDEKMDKPQSLQNTLS